MKSRLSLIGYMEMAICATTFVFLICSQFIVESSTTSKVDSIMDSGWFQGVVGFFYIYTFNCTMRHYFAILTGHVDNGDWNLEMIICAATCLFLICSWFIVEGIASYKIDIIMDLGRFQGVVGIFFIYTFNCTMKQHSAILTKEVESSDWNLGMAICAATCLFLICSMFTVKGTASSMTDVIMDSGWFKGVVSIFFIYTCNCYMEKHSAMLTGMYASFWSQFGVLGGPSTSPLSFLGHDSCCHVVSRDFTISCSREATQPRPSGK